MVAIWLTMHHKSVALYQHGWHYWIINCCLFFLTENVSIYSTAFYSYIALWKLKIWIKKFGFSKNIRSKKQQMRGIHVKFILTALFKCNLPNNNNNHGSETQLYKTTIPHQRLTCFVHLHILIRYYVLLCIIRLTSDMNS